MLKKDGITLAILAVGVAVMAIIIAVAVVSVQNTINYSTLRAFATELNTIQNVFNEYNKNSTEDLYIQDMEYTINDSFKAEQFGVSSGNNVTVHVLDLNKLNIEKTAYGKLVNQFDVYAVNDAGVVYYLAGIKAGSSVYYTLTTALKRIVSSEEDTSPNSTSEVIFNANTTNWTNEAVRVQVTFPSSATSESLSCSNSVSYTSSGAIYTCNSGSALKSYTITATYTLSGTTKTITYQVDNYDGTSPIISSSITSNLAIDGTVRLHGVVATDALSGIKTLRYCEGDVSGRSDIKTYMQEIGEEVKSQDIYLGKTTARVWTIYTEDNAGNIATRVVTLP